MGHGSMGFGSAFARQLNPGHQHLEKTTYAHTFGIEDDSYPGLTGATGKSRGPVVVEQEPSTPAWMGQLWTKSINQRSPRTPAALPPLSVQVPIRAPF